MKFLLLCILLTFSVFADGLDTHPYATCQVQKGMGKIKGCIKIYQINGKYCADKEGTVCEGEDGSIQGLCIKVGKKVDIPFEEFNSGQGLFKTEQECVATCEKYASDFGEFGGKCKGMLKL